MKKIVKLSVAAIVSTLALANVAQAAMPGAYAGIGLGGSRLDTPNEFLTLTDEGDLGVPTKKTKDIGGLGGRVFAGYNFNQYIGVEGGYAKYARSLYKLSVPSIFNESVEWNMSAVTVVAKGYLPLGESRFNVYALGGAAEVFGETKATASGLGLSDQEKKSVSKLRPTYGVGVSYDVNSHITTNLEFSRIQGQGNLKKSSKATANADLVTLNVAYNFG